MAGGPFGCEKKWPLPFGQWSELVLNALHVFGAQWTTETERDGGIALHCMARNEDVVRGDDADLHRLHPFTVYVMGMGMNG